MLALAAWVTAGALAPLRAWATGRNQAAFESKSLDDALAAAVADGLAATARVITAAALIMVCVFGAFVLGNDRQLKLFGLGMAVAVAVDATIVRMILVPATMELLGSRNWWIPAWLDRILPRIEVEGHHPETDAAALDDGDDDDRPLGDREPQLV
jgi:RND superfamily putative drug exporter